MQTIPKETLAAKHVLMVDDDDMMRILFREMFWIYSSPAKTDVVTVPSIEDAYEKIKENGEPDVLVLGLSLLTKNANGIASPQTVPSLKLIKETKQKNAAVKVVVYSHHTEPELQEIAKEAGADAYVVKGERTPREMVTFIEQL